MELLENLQQVHAKSAASENGKKELELKLDSALNTISSYKVKSKNAVLFYSFYSFYCFIYIFKNVYR